MLCDRARGSRIGRGDPHGAFRVSQKGENPLKELSLNVLDVAENGIKAGATLVTVTLLETETGLTLTIGDNGCGMSEEVVQRVIDPFYTTRTTRKVGMGVPLLKLAAEQTSGSFAIASRTAEADPVDHGTTVTATFDKTHLDFTPIGDMVSTMTTLIMGSPHIDFLFLHEAPQREVSLDTRQLREVLGEDVPLDSYEVIKWIEEYLNEQYASSVS
ncbi:MAG: ATP-binding protein [Clostridia bacterium]|nr:ATP-binding protein [Clostridia bacterium]